METGPREDCDQLSQPDKQKHYFIVYSYRKAAPEGEAHRPCPQPCAPGVQQLFRCLGGGQADLPAACWLPGAPQLSQRLGTPHPGAYAAVGRGPQTFCVWQERKPQTGGSGEWGWPLVLPGDLEHGQFQRGDPG